MLLSVPSNLDAAYPDDQNEDVQIEISVDPAHDVFMIMVTSQECDIQSVVAVPKKAARKMPSGRQANTRSSVTGLPPKFPQAEKIVEKQTERGRRADCMRPSSPLNRGRSYAIEPRNNSVSRRSRSRQVVMPRQRSGLRRDESVLLRRSSSTRSNAPLSDSAISRQPRIKTLTDTHNNVEIRLPKSRKVVAPRQRRETRSDESVCSSTMGSRQLSSKTGFRPAPRVVPVRVVKEKSSLLEREGNENGRNAGLS
jgi:hypothetical protein